MKIAFIGLGNMGKPMARNLLKAGHALTVYDLTAEPVEAQCAAGAAAAASAADAARVAEVVITMLPSSPHVREAYTTANGVLAAAQRDALLLDCSTIDPHTARAVAALAAERGNAMLDAPVSGGTGGAEAATLTFMVGGDPGAFERAKPVLASMGKNFVHCGASGNGQVAKICNNMLLAISMIGTAEAMMLGAKLGIDPKLLAGIINTSSGRCWSSDTYNPYPGVIQTAPASRYYTGGFGAELMLKDLGLAVDAARAAKQPVALGGLAQQLYQMMNARGDGGKDFSAIINLFSGNVS
jgi:3-hydroxyisobutyrate dehydrogenase